MKIIAIDDFTGGRVNFKDQALIENNQCASGSMNVWAPEGGLTKGPGLTLQSSFTASGATMTMPWFYADDSASTSTANNLFRLFYRIAQTSTGNSAATNFYPFGSTVTFTDALTALGYTTGTISISGANLISATGSGTLWTTGGGQVVANDRIQVTAFGSGWYNVASVEDDTHLTLSAAVPAAVATGTNYVSQPAMNAPEIAAASLAGYISITTTADTWQTFNGIGINRTRVPPQAAYLAVFKNYMFAARTYTALSRVYWSAIKDPTTWPANNFVDVDSAMNGRVAGLYAHGPELLVFKTRGLYRIIGDVFDPSNPQYYVLRIQTPQDFMFNSNYGVSTHGHAVVFYGGGRIYRYITGTNFITDISPSILRDLPTQFGSLYETQNNIDQKIQGTNYLGYYILKGLQDPNNSNSPMCLVLDPKGSWWYLSNRNAATSTDPLSTGKMAIVPSTTVRPQLAVGLDTSPKIFTWDFVGPSFGTNYPSTAAAGTNSNVAINGTWISKEFNIEYGTFKWIVIYLKKQSAGNLTVQWSVDQAANVSYTLDMTVGRGQIIRSVIPIQQKGSTIQLTLSNNTASQTFKIYGIKIFYEESTEERLR